MAKNSETGLYYYGARYYDPRTSIWLSTDPLMEKYPGFNPYCYQNPVNFVDPTGMESTSPIFDKKTGAFLGVDDKGWYEGDVLFMDSEKYKGLLSNAKANKKDNISHTDAVKNSISIANLPENLSGIMLFFKATDYLSKRLYEEVYESSASKLLLNRIYVMSVKLGGKGTPGAESLLDKKTGGSDYGQSSDVVGYQRVTIAFDHRRELNTAGDILSLFEHEYRFHGLMGLRRTTSFDPHKEVYKLQVESPVFQHTSGVYREHLVNFYNSYWPNNKIKE